MKHNSLRLLLLVLSLTFFVGCQQMRSTEYGVVVRTLPPMLGGGVSSKIIDRGQTVFIWPWESVYRFDTSTQYVSWGPQEKGSRQSQHEYVYTRALDGNEVALAVTIQFHVDGTQDKLLHIIENVATSNEEILNLVEAVARADIRTQMNSLRTSAFFDRNARYKAIELVQNSMNNRLNKEGIIIDRVILDEHRFERLLPNGKIDRSYQEKIDETQELAQDTERELLRIETIRAQKKQELNDVQAQVNRIIAEAEGYKKQATVKGDGYFQVKENQALGIKSRGENELQAFEAELQALSGPGGRSMVKLEIARRIIESNPKFIVLGDSGGSTLGVNRIDSNDLLNQLGILEGVGVPKTPTTQPKK